MKKIIVIGTVFLLGVGGYFLITRKQGALSPLQMSPTQTSPTPQMLVGKKYTEYSQPVFENAAKARRVLFFYANWCPTCRPADADFVKNEARIPEDTIVIRVNYNDSDTDPNEKELAAKYGVTYQHTFVQIGADGKEVTKWNGGATSELLTNIK